MTSAPVALFMRNLNGLVNKVVNITETIYKARENIKIKKIIIVKFLIIENRTRQKIQQAIVEVGR